MAGGIGLVLSIAKDAMAAQQYGIYVSGHNISNVNTEGYSKQSAVQEAKRPAPFGGVLLGRGVDTTQITRSSDQIIENRVFAETSDLHSYESMSNYMIALEAMFNENSDTSLSNLIGDFWNRWHDIANNPSGTAERVALYEHSKLLANGLNDLDTDLEQMRTDLTKAIEAGVERINEITTEIGNLNNEIAGMEIDASANDLRDQRNVLCAELSEYIDTKIFEQSNGSFSIISARGVVLVDGKDGYGLQLDGTAVEWVGSGGNEVDITDEITKGKLGGFLEMRDEVVAEYKQNLTELTSDFIWAVNGQHSQGVGLEGRSSVSGTYAASAPGNAITNSGLSFEDKVDDTNQTFEIWLFDNNGDPYDTDGGTAGVQPVTITVTPGMTVDGVGGLVETIDDEIGLQASITDGIVSIGVDTGEVASIGSLAFANDNANVLAALGINTFFTGSTAGSIDVNSTFASSKDYIAAAQIDASTGEFATGDNTNALAIADLQYVSRDITEHSYNRDPDIGNTSGTVSGTIEEYYHSLVGALGIKASSVERSASFSKTMLHELKTMRESISSVSLDEEMTQLMQYQHAYAAAAKLLSASDEMLQTLLAAK